MEAPSRPAVPPASPGPAARAGAPVETPSETTRRLRPVGPDAGAVRAPDPALSWSAPPSPAAGRPVVSFGEPEVRHDEGRWSRGRNGARVAAVAACLVLGLGLVGGAVTGSWLVGDSEAAGARDSFVAARSLWHSVPVDQLFPTRVAGQGAGPGGADRAWTRIAVAPDSGCKNAFDPLLRKALAPVGCQRLLRATYTDATQTYVTTVGLLFTKADATAMASLAKRFTDEELDRRTDLMPRPYGPGLANDQRATWTVSVLTDAPVVVYSVSGWADGRTVDEPQSAEDAMESGATTAPAQAGLGHEAKGLADRIERALRKQVGPYATEQAS